MKYFDTLNNSPMSFAIEKSKEVKMTDFLVKKRF